MTWEDLKLEAAGHIRNELGEPVIFHYQEGQSVNLTVVFTMADVQIADGGQVPVDSTQPVCKIWRCDVTRKPRQGDTLTRRNITYEVLAARPSLDAGWLCPLHVVDDKYANRPRDRT
ncbi:MAG: hypothetical protein Q8N13_11140 [Acidovorax sp.]|nr:hypothetical protein [Acidovorax sp.]